MKINGNTILITGGASGIGFALAQKFTEYKNKVIIAGRNESKLKTACESIPDCDYVVCDITRPNDIDNLILDLQNNHPDLNILINNAGIQYNYYLDDETNPQKKIEDEINTNFTAPVKITSLLLPQLMVKKEAAVVNISSALSIAPKENAAVYCATKAAISSFTETLCYQLEKTAVHVLELVPPLVDTKMTEGRGVNKVAPDVVADALIHGFEKNIQQINVGKVKILRVLNRIAPSLVKKMMRGSTK